MADYRGAGYPFRHRSSMDIMAWFIPFLLFLGIATHPLPEFISLTFSFIAVMAIKVSVSPGVTD